MDQESAAEAVGQSQQQRIQQQILAQKQMWQQRTPQTSSFLSDGMQPSGSFQTSSFQPNGFQNSYQNSFQSNSFDFDSDYAFLRHEQQQQRMRFPHAAHRRTVSGFGAVLVAADPNADPSGIPAQQHFQPSGAMPAANQPPATSTARFLHPPQPAAAEPLGDGYMPNAERPQRPRPSSTQILADFLRNTTPPSVTNSSDPSSPPPQASPKRSKRQTGMSFFQWSWKKPSPQNSVQSIDGQNQKHTPLQVDYDPFNHDQAQNVASPTSVSSVSSVSSASKEAAASPGRAQQRMLQLPTRTSVHYSVPQGDYSAYERAKAAATNLHQQPFVPPSVVAGPIKQTQGQRPVSHASQRNTSIPAAQQQMPQAPVRQRPVSSFIPPGQFRDDMLSSAHFPMPQQLLPNQSKNSQQYQQQIVSQSAPSGLGYLHGDDPSTSFASFGFQQQQQWDQNQFNPQNSESYSTSNSFDAPPASNGTVYPSQSGAAPSNDASLGDRSHVTQNMPSDLEHEDDENVPEEEEEVDDDFDWVDEELMRNTEFNANSTFESLEIGLSESNARPKPLKPRLNVSFEELANEIRYSDDADDDMEDEDDEDDNNDSSAQTQTTTMHNILHTNSGSKNVVALSIDPSGLVAPGQTNEFVSTPTRDSSLGHPTPPPSLRASPVPSNKLQQLPETAASAMNATASKSDQPNRRTDSLVDSKPLNSLAGPSQDHSLSQLPAIDMKPFMQQHDLKNISFADASTGLSLDSSVLASTPGAQESDIVSVNDAADSMVASAPLRGASLNAVVDSPKRKKRVRHVQIQTRGAMHRDADCQTDANLTNQGIDAETASRIASLEAELADLRDRNVSLSHKLDQTQEELSVTLDSKERLIQMMGDNRQKFDRLSSQAYNKIKELLMDRQILEVEVKALRSQIESLDVKYQEWTESDLEMSSQLEYRQNP